MIEFIKKFISIRKKRKLGKATLPPKTKPQYTKVLVTSITIMACIWISTSYVFAGYSLIIYGNTNPLSELSQQVIIVILGTVVSYSVKSYWEKYSEEKNKITMVTNGIISSASSDDEVCG